MQSYRKVIQVDNWASNNAGARRQIQLQNLAKDANGRFAYLVGLIFAVTATATETAGGAGIPLTAIGCADMLHSVSLKYGNHQRLNALSGLSLLRLALQIDGVIGSQTLAKFWPQTAVVTTGGDTTVTTYYPFLCAPRYFQGRGAGRFDGCIPISELVKSSQCEIVLGDYLATSATKAGVWRLKAGTGTVVTYAIVVELPHPVEHVFMREIEQTSLEKTLKLEDSGRVRRIAGLLVCDSFTAPVAGAGGPKDLVLPTSWQMTLDGRIIESNGDAVIDNVVSNLMNREQDINTPFVQTTTDYATAKAFVVYPTTAEDMTDRPPVAGEAVLDGVGTQHSRAYMVLSRLARRATLQEMRDILSGQSVDNRTIDAYINDVQGKSGGGVGVVGVKPASGALGAMSELDRAGAGLVTIKGLA